VGSTGFGMVNSVISVGALIGVMLIMANIFKDKYKLTVLGLTLEGISLMMFGGFLNYYVILVAAALLGLGLSMASVGISTLYQTLIPKDKMGRVLGIVSTICTVTVPIGTLFGSFIIEYADLTLVLILSGVIVFATGLGLVPLLKAAKTEDPKTGPQPV